MFEAKEKLFELNKLNVGKFFFLYVFKRDTQKLYGAVKAKL